MKVKQFFNKKIAIIFFLAITAGLPLALILSTLKVMLVDKGFNLQTIGFMSLVGLPYSLKIFYAPFMDACAVPYLTRILGQRRSWIILTQFALMSLILMLGFVINEENLFFIATVSFAIAFASASQDIVIDAYRIELIDKESQGMAAAFYTYGYRIGMLISGAFALFLSDKISWSLVCFILSLMMLIGVFAVLFADDTRKNWQSKNYDFAKWTKNYIITPFLDFTNHKQWYIILAFIIFFKLSDVFAGTLTVPFLLIIEYTKTEIAMIVKTFGLFATFAGVFCGGILVKKLGTYKSLWIAALAQMFSNLSFAYLAKIGHNVDMLYFVIFIENFSGGIGDAVFVAYLSALCNISFSATQYATLISFATIGRSLFSSSAGIVALKLGWYNFFIFSTILAIPGLIFLWILRKNQSR